MYLLLSKLDDIDKKIQLSYKGETTQDCEIIDPYEFMKKNAEWWTSTPNEKALRMTPGGGLDFPTNFMTDYSLDDIGGDPDIVALNRKCISVEGQSSTVHGEDTTINSKGPSNSVQRGYLCVLLPYEQAEQLFDNLNANCTHMVSLELCEKINNDLKYRMRRNAKWKEEVKGCFGIKSKPIWVTLRKEDEKWEIITRNHDAPGLLGDYSSKINKDYLQFNHYVFSDVTKFGLVTIITHEVGLDDDTRYPNTENKTLPFKLATEKGESLPKLVIRLLPHDYIQPKT